MCLTICPVFCCRSKTDFDKLKLDFIHWSNGFQLVNHDKELVGEAKFMELIETSRALKKHYLNDHNSLYADIFRISELRSYYYYLKAKLTPSIISRENEWSKWGNNKWFSKFGTGLIRSLSWLLRLYRKISRELVVNWLILGTNKWFSKFGTDPIRSLIWLLGLHLFFFFPLLIINNPELGYELDLNPTSSDWSLAYSINLLNPIHSLKDPAGKQVYSVIDFFMRISSGYFIYYFLKGTRKFG